MVSTTTSICIFIHLHKIMQLLTWPDSIRVVGILVFIIHWNRCIQERTLLMKLNTSDSKKVSCTFSQRAKAVVQPALLNLNSKPTRLHDHTDGSVETRKGEVSGHS